VCVAKNYFEGSSRKHKNSFLSFRRSVPFPFESVEPTESYRMPGLEVFRDLKVQGVMAIARDR
jgi:hypothetical protein